MILTALTLAPIHPFGGTSTVEGTAAITQQLIKSPAPARRL
jgi:hypothetical protein